MSGARAYIVGPWVGSAQLKADLRSVLVLIGGRLCDHLDDGATSIIRVRAAGLERWVEVDAPLAAALLTKPALRAFELLVEAHTANTRAWLYRVRLDPKARGVLVRSDEEELALPAGMDDEDRGDIAGDLALKRIASLTDPTGSTSTWHLFVQLP